MVSKGAIKRKDTFNLLNIKFKNSQPHVNRLPVQFDKLEGYDEASIRQKYDFHEKFIWRVIENTEGGE
jgi:hypothetical protein